MTKKSKAEQDELNKRHLEKMTELLGTTNGSSNWREKIRIHQGWWRAFVLGISEGEYYDNRNKIWKRICNQVFQETSTDDINFLSNTQSASAVSSASVEDIEMPPWRRHPHETPAPPRKITHPLVERVWRQLESAKACSWSAIGACIE